jgi:ubiquinone/menaquinone biosynthesis C-methylase UbiE
MSTKQQVETKSKTSDADQLRQALKALWAGVAPGWDEHAEFADARGAGVAEQLLNLTALEPGERVLELACGPGGLGLSAARRVGPDGEVVLTDVAGEMTSIAAARAAEHGLTNVTTRELDLESIDEPDGSFDAVLCREGLMLVPDPDRAAAEMVRVLRPGARLAVAVWGPQASNPWLGSLFDAVTAELGHPVPPPGMPGPFSIDDPQRLARILSEGGLGEVVVNEYPTPYRDSSFESMWTRVVALAGPLAKMLAAQPPETVEAIRTRMHDSLSAYEGAGRFDIPGVSLLGSGGRVG